MTAEQMRGISIETPKDPAELLFDSIMADVRARKKAGEDISFKTHPNYQQWLNLRNQNFEATKTKEQQQQYFSGDAEDKKESAVAPVKMATDLRMSANDRRIEAETVANEKAQAAYYAKREAEQAAAQVEQAETAKLDFGHYKKGTIDLNKITPAQARIDADQERARELSKEIKGEKLDLIRVRGIVDSLSEKLTDYQAKSEVFKELGETWFARTKNYLKRERLTNEMADLNAEITELFAVLKKDFKLAKAESRETAKLIEVFNELDQHVSSGELKLEVLGYASNFLILAAKLGMLVSMAQADLPHQKVEDRSGRPDVAAKFSNDDKMDTGESVTLQSGEAGYRVASEHIKNESHEGSEEKLKEVFSLTEAEAGRVNNFTEWRHAILEPEYIGKVKKDGTIPSTEKALHVDAGTKIEITVDGVVLLSDEVKKEKGKSSLWAVLEKNKKAIEKIAKKEGWGNIDIWVTGNEYKGAQSKNEPVEKTAKKAKVESKAVAPKVKEPSEPKEPKVKKATVEKTPEKTPAEKKATKKTEQKGAAEEQKAEVVETKLSPAEIGNLLKQNGIELKHVMGGNYNTEEEYETAIQELKIAQRTIQEAIPPALDKEASDQALKMLESVRLFQLEIERLNAAKEAKAIARHQAIIDKEGKIPEAASPEKVYSAESVKISDLAPESEISLRAGKYGGPLIKAHKILQSVAALSPHYTSEADDKKYLAQVEEAKGFYNLLIKEGGVDDKFPSKEFLVEQGKLGKELAVYEIKALKKSIQEKKEKRERKEAEKAAQEAQAKLKDLAEIVPEKIVQEMQGAVATMEMLYLVDTNNHVAREMYKISSVLKRMTTNKESLEDFEKHIELVEKISNDLRLAKNAGKLEIPKKYLTVLQQLDDAIQHAGDIIFITLENDSKQKE